MLRRIRILSHTTDIATATENYKQSRQRSMQPLITTTIANQSLNARTWKKFTATANVTRTLTQKSQPQFLVNYGSRLQPQLKKQNATGTESSNCNKKTRNDETADNKYRERTEKEQANNKTHKVCTQSLITRRATPRS